LITADRSYTAIAWINISITSLLLVNPLDNIIIIDRIVGYSKYNKPSIPITQQGSIYWFRAVPRPEVSLGLISKVLSNIRGSILRSIVCY
jgi:hypothetical protein